MNTILGWALLSLANLPHSMGRNTTHECKYLLSYRCERFLITHTTERIERLKNVKQCNSRILHLCLIE